MRTYRNLIAATLALLPVYPAGATIYVWQSSPGPVHNGSNWGSAYTSLTAALAAAPDGESVWVATGTYTGAFVVPAGVKVYGGFAGNEAQLTKRNPTRNVTILDGNQTGTVVLLADRTRIDGFTIQRGFGSDGGGVRANDLAVTSICNNIIQDNTARYDGAGIYLLNNKSEVCGNLIRRNAAGENGGGIGIFGPGHIEEDSPRMFDNVIRDNTAGIDGGGVWAYYTTPRFERNLVWFNHANNNGGGMYTYHSYSPILWNHFWGNTCNANDPIKGRGGGGLCVGFHSVPELMDNVFEGNRAPLGGAVFNGYQTEAMTWRNLVVGNKATDKGGAFYMETGAYPTLYNNIILRNKANAGGAIYIYKSSPKIRHNTIASNSALSGGAVVLEYYASPTIGNNIFWRNTALDAGVLVKDVLSGPNLAANCLWENAQPNVLGLTDPVGTVGNIALDPLFLDTSMDAFQLQGNSPCVDAGDTGMTDVLDFNNRARPLDGDMNGVSTPDIGAYEFGAGPMVLTGMHQAYRLPSGTVVAIPSRVANASFAGGFFVQDFGRKRGLKVLTSSPAPAAGAVVSAQGTLTDIGEERVLGSAVWTGTGTAYGFAPAFAVNNRMVGLPAPVSTWGTSGLVVTTAGRVSSLEPDGFWMSDGLETPVRVFCAVGSIPLVQSYCVVTGVADWQSGGRVLYTRTSWDISSQ